MILSIRVDVEIDEMPSADAEVIGEHLCSQFVDLAGKLGFYLYDEEVLVDP